MAAISSSVTVSRNQLAYSGMATTNVEVRSTLSLIESTRLPHPSGPLLESFVFEALNPVQAARYVKQRLLLGEASSLVADWSYIVECSNSTPLFCSARRSNDYSQSKWLTSTTA